MDDVVFGVVSPVGEQGSDMARIAVLAAGWDESAPGTQVNRFCASGLEAVNIAAAKVALRVRRTWWWRAASSRCRGCRWARTAARGWPTRQTSMAVDFVPQGVAPT